MKCKILTCLLAQLLGWKNDLDGLSVMGVRDWMVHQANGSDDLANRFYIIALALGVHHVTWITYHERGFGCLVSAPNSCNFAAFHNYFVDLSIQHVCSSVNGAQS